MTRTHWAMVVVLAGGCVALGAIPIEPPGDVLAGPRIAPEAKATSLVESEMTGGIKRLDVPPDEAALELLDLNDETKAACQRILVERAAALDAFVADNLTTLLEASNARQAGDAAEARRLFRELMGRAGPLRARGKLGDELRSVMPPEAAAEHRRLVEEYWRAIVAEAGGAGGGGDMQPRGGAIERESIRAIGEEIRRSYERQAAERQGQLDEFLGAMNLPPERETKIRNILIDDFQKNQGKGDRASRFRTFMRVYRELEGEERQALVEFVRAREGT